MAGDTGMARKVALLLWAQTLGLAGAQTTQLLVEPPWRPAVLWDPVTLTCQGSGTAGATTWYKDGKLCWQKGEDHFTVTNIGTYTCHRPGSGRSPPVTVSNDDLVLQAPVRELLEGDNVTLRCRGKWNRTVTSVSFYREGTELRGLPDGAELSLSPLQLKHSGRYRCRGRVDSWPGRWWRSGPLKVTVHVLFSVPVLEGPPEITEGSPLTLSCRSTPSPLRPPAPLLYLFYQDGRVLGGPQESPQLLLPAVGVSHSGNYSCEAQAQGGTVRKSSALIRVTVTVHMPVANATITPGPLAHQVHTGDNVTLHCSVQVGSAPVTFTWLHNGHEVARGPLLELKDIDVGDSGTYQCKATNQLGQDGHRVFRAFSPELALEVTPGSPWVTVAAGVSGALLFLLLLVGAIVAWHRWHRVAARKNQERAPPDPPAPPEEGEVLYTHVVVTKRAEASPGATTVQDPQVTYAELRGHQGRSQEPGDIYGNVL
ncbi:Fc receptor-like protein 3 isoform X2 [Zonotrichia albicollis]|uniref:Fc receptor-like protein 3 isoform X2 n=1 Tax=Zonotrichia albicollis TaxID=44394 RepID=UPI003D80FCB1